MKIQFSINVLFNSIAPKDILLTYNFILDRDKLELYPAKCKADD